MLPVYTILRVAAVACPALTWWTLANKNPTRSKIAPEDRPLTPKQKALADAYMLPGATKAGAAIAAGYPERSATAQAISVLGLPQVIKYMAPKLKKAADKYEITRDRVLAEYAKIAFMSMEDVLEDDGNGKPSFKKFGDIGSQAKASISEITIDVRKEFEGRGDDREHVADVERIRFKTHDKVKALDALGRHLKLFPKDSDPSDENPSEGRHVKVNVRGGLPQAPLKKAKASE